MADRLRALNNDGLERFRAYLGRLRHGAPGDPPREILAAATYTRELPVDVAIEPRTFATRLDAARYLCEVLEPLGAEATDRDRGLWAWLALYFFDQVCPPAANGARQPGQPYRHLPDFHYRYRHRHLLYGPYEVYRRHGEASILLLAGPLSSESTIYQEIAGRQDLIANRSVVGAALELYFDRDRGAPKRGAQDARASPGTIRRFVRVLQQLDVTYDVYGLTPAQILDLLPREFDAWRT
jgi:hypothetical protein